MPKDSGLDGGGPAGVVDGPPGKLKEPGGLLVGVEAPKGADVDVGEPILPNKLPLPVLLAPPNPAVAGGFDGCSVLF